MTQTLTESLRRNQEEIERWRWNQKGIESSRQTKARLSSVIVSLSGSQGKILFFLLCFVPSWLISLLFLSDLMFCCFLMNNQNEKQHQNIKTNCVCVLMFCGVMSQFVVLNEIADNVTYQYHYKSYSFSKFLLATWHDLLGESNWS